MLSPGSLIVTKMQDDVIERYRMRDLANPHNHYEHMHTNTSNRPVLCLRPIAGAVGWISMQNAASSTPHSY